MDEIAGEGEALNPSIEVEEADPQVETIWHSNPEEDRQAEIDASRHKVETCARYLADAEAAAAAATSDDEIEIASRKVDKKAEYLAAAQAALVALESEE